MADQVSWRVVLAVRPQQLDSFIALTEEMVEATRKELGVLSYERFITSDGSSVHVYERYVDSESAIQHLKQFKEQFSKRFSTMVDRTQFVVYGSPTAELREVLDVFQPSYLRPLGGLDYWS